jgi:hypothetical protein
MPAKIYPEGSYLLRFSKEFKSNIFWGKFWGWMCMPVCCMGCICLLPAKIFEALIEDIQKIIKIYTPHGLTNLARRISDEQSIFMEACNIVNSKTQYIFPDVNLVDVICVMRPNLKSMLSMLYVYDILGMNKQSKDAYLSQIYQEYTAKGGNENVIIYGLPEYLSRFNDPTCDKMLNLFKKLASETQLSNFVFSHRDKTE